MNVEEITKVLQNEIEKRIEKVKETRTTFTIRTACGIIIANDYKFLKYSEGYMDLYMNNKHIATINIWLIEEIE
jgi:uncharacterized protein YacL (UPF0231 family)